MVNPIPARHAYPSNDLQFTACGSLAIPVFTAINANIMIPSGLPNISPANIPNPISACCSDRSILTPAFANAKSGITTNAEKLCNACSSLSIGAVRLPLARSSAKTVSCCPLLVKTTKLPVSVRSNPSSSERASLENSSALMRERAGMVKARATPAIVACTPES